MGFKQVPGCKFYIQKFRGDESNKYKLVLEDKFAKDMMILESLCSCVKKSRAYVLLRNIIVKLG
jgi:hypothetical protein